jgi:mannose-1-phosphate guanylyltransferase/mannose-1-phosphate guanylyltransferase/mannose-6-phosphate isomerase
MRDTYFSSTDFIANAPLGARADLISPVLLSGGSGTRLWPLSRKSFPKQFVALTGDESPFQASAKRLHCEGFADPLIVTQSDYRFIVKDQLQAAGICPSDILIEPSPRNTGPAILAAALRIAETNADGLILICPTDHQITDVAAFRDVVLEAAGMARLGQIVTFGIKPTRAETGYGYLELDLDDDSGTALKRFVEKPDKAAAETMASDGKHLWNAGIFLATAETLIAAYRAYDRASLHLVQTSLDSAERDLDFLRLGCASWQALDDMSIDYAVMEKAGNVCVMPFSGDWVDLGDWDSVFREADSDQDQVVAHGNALAMDCRNTLLRAEGNDQQVVGLGLENMIVVATGDSVLVADKSRAQDVKQVVTALREDGAHQADKTKRDFRPWGWFESLVIAETFQVKRIVVNPGGKLSLQSHKRRAEHWVIVSGIADVTIEDRSFQVFENQSIYIPTGSKHRLENTSDDALILIEVQTGTYFGEDDITRYDDIYARN